MGSGIWHVGWPHVHSPFYGCQQFPSTPFLTAISIHQSFPSDVASNGHILISITLVWLHDRFILALTVPVTVAFTVPTLAASCNDLHSSHGATCKQKLQDSLFSPRCPAKCPALGEMSHRNWSCCMFGLPYLLGMVSVASIDTYILSLSSALAPEMWPSPWAVHRAALCFWRVTRAVSGSLFWTVVQDRQGMTTIFPGDKEWTKDWKGLIYREYWVLHAGGWIQEILPKGV